MNTGPETRTPAFLCKRDPDGGSFQVTEGWCAECGRAVLTASIDTVAAAAAIPLTTLYAKLEAGEIHAAETADGLVQVCVSAPATFWATCEISIP